MSHVHVTAPHGAHTRVFPEATYDVSPAGVLVVHPVGEDDIVFSPVGWSRVFSSDDDPALAESAPARGRVRQLLGLE